MKTREARETDVVRPVELKGCEYVSIGTLAKLYDVSYKMMVDIISRLQLTHEVRVLILGGRSLRVNLAEFRRALMDCATVTTQIAEKGGAI